MTQVTFTPSEIAAQHNITAYQLSLATKVIIDNGRQAFYIVESASDPGTEYKVIWNRERKCLQCLPHNGKRCPASAHGLPCWHKRAAAAAEQLLRQAERRARQVEQARIEATAAYQVEQAINTAENALAALDRIAAKDAARAAYNYYEMAIGII